MHQLYLICFLLVSTYGYGQVVWDEYYTYINGEIHTAANTSEADKMQFIGLKDGKPVLIELNKEGVFDEVKGFKSKLPFEIDAIFKIDDDEFLGIGYKEDKILLGVIGLSGKTLWKKEISLKAEIRTITKTEEEGYLLGGIKDDNMFLYCIDKKGRKVWEQSYGGAGKDGILSILRLKEGGYIVGGYTDLYNTTETDMIVMEIDKEGKNKWERAFGEPELKEQVCLLTLSKTGNILLVGQSGGGIWILAYNQESQNIIYEQLIEKEKMILLPILIGNLIGNNFLIGASIETEESNNSINQNESSSPTRFFLMQYKIQD